MSEPSPKPYLTIRRSVSHETEIKKSRFICHLARVADEDEAQAFIAAVRKQYWDARHNCTAFVVGDGSPRGGPMTTASPAVRRACRCWRCCGGAG